MGNEQAAVLAEGMEGGAAVEESSQEPEWPRARVRAIDRQQRWLRSVVVEELVEEPMRCGVLQAPILPSAAGKTIVEQ